MTFSTVKKNLESIDYEWTKPQTYLVFVPGLSLVIQKIQLAKTLPLICLADVVPGNAQRANQKSRHFANICKWHLRGSLTQLIASAIAIKTFATPLFFLTSILAIYELLSTALLALKNPVTISEFHSNGNLKRTETLTALNIF